MVSYEAFSRFAGTWGLVLLVVMFVIALAYALWPSNQDKFNRAARNPLDDERGPDAYEDADRQPRNGDAGSGR
ncbi:hypothetical protein CCR85_10930 [Rhodothalassium salexigens]|uniref:cbb3-type cytochrome c oxidase subunit 3 n=1 Tax=Rhodothalassium salexigens TaxID=1086 RepID=UPI0019120E81|nr:cbb3-type cytochrome c oxidase subunit 3 [Rhodothalassium salexigens]MBK5912002.1 hypothetical protein [Rhodothalassium salexigens]MBK5922160.1 hypothetical protein [Rhodothalassium salexigens]